MGRAPSPTFGRLRHIFIDLPISPQQQPFVPLFIDIDVIGLAHIPFPDLPQHPAARAGVSERARRAAVVVTRRFMFVLLGPFD
jgi:hypothetical protein